LRVLVNPGPHGAEAASSLISPFVSMPEPLGGIVNVMLTLVSLVFPWPLVSLGGLYYLFLTVVFVLIWISFGLSVRERNASRIPSASRFRFDRAVALVMAFLSTQALFEPDYGSALRHLTPLLPLIVYVVWQATAARAASVSEEPSNG
jgi:hypothetical protein